MASHTFLSARARWLLLDSRGVDFTRAYHAIFASRPLLEVIIFQGPYEGFGRFRRTVEQKTLESHKSQSETPSTPSMSLVPPEIGVKHARIGGKHRRIAVQKNATILHDIGAVGDLQRIRRHLFDQQDREPFAI